MSGPAPDAGAASVPTAKVKGGGGSGGGGSGGKGKKGKGKAKAKKGKGKQDPKGGKKSAKKSKKGGAKNKGSGKGSKCPMCSAGASRGDPIDVVTGRAFTLPIEDLALPGPLPLGFERTYSSAAHDRDVGLGFGWAHSFAWEIILSRAHVSVWTDDGREINFAIPRLNEEVLGDDGWVLRREQAGYVLDTGEDERYVFTRSATSDTRYRLTAVVDNNKNQISLTYDEAGHLSRITDCVGRDVRVMKTREGRIASLAVKNAKHQGQWIDFAKYLYDERGDLTQVTDADGYTWQFNYYEDHLLASHRAPTGLTFYFRYDEEHRCTETWGDYGTRPDPSLSASLPKTLADGVTRAKGIQHVKVAFFPEGYSEATSSTETERFSGNEFGKVDRIVGAGGPTTREFDDHGHVLAVTDPLGATTRYVRDLRGRLLEETDALGNTTVYKRDANGSVVECIDPAGHAWSASYDRFGNLVMKRDPLGAVTQYKWNARGQLVEAIDPCGGRTVIEYDDEANLTRLIEASGAEWRAAYDAFGRRLSTTNPMGHTTTFRYSLRGDMTAILDAEGDLQHYAYDGCGNITQVIDANGLVVRIQYGGYHEVCRVEASSGKPFEMKYDREGRLLEVYNEHREVHLHKYNAMGALIWEKHFDGREQHYRFDGMGQLTRYVNGMGAATEFEYDLVGNLVARRFHDDEEVLVWNKTGSIVSATNKSGTWAFERDACDRVVKEIQTSGGATYAIERKYDLVGLPVGVRTSLGHAKEIERDSGGHARRLTLDGITHSLTKDLLGRETARTLPRGGRLESFFDARGNLSRRRVASPSTQRPVANEPAWLGPRTGTHSVDLAYRYSAGAELTDAWDQARGLTRYENDPMGRLLAVLPDGVAPELFRYDDTDNVFEATPGAPTRSYGAGNRLLRKGDVEWIWDGDAQLSERKIDRVDGGQDIWKYAWGGKGVLESVTRPDGSHIDFAYDPFFRRVSKRLFDARGTCVVETHFVYDNAVLAHEVRRVASAVGDPIVEERTYCYDDGSFEPWAHRDVKREGAKAIASEWFHYVNDVVGAPVDLVDGRGDIACALERSAWGAMDVAPAAQTTTPLRLLGQYADDETGLAYNRYRYYDPDTARYVSADPIGLYGGNNEFRYAPSPLEWVDPWGLKFSEHTKELGERMEAAGKPFKEGQTPHHIVQRNGPGKAGQAILKRNGIVKPDGSADVDHPSNGARLWGTHPDQRAAHGKAKRCKGAHLGNDIHGAKAQKAIAKELRAAETAGGGAGTPGAQAAVLAKLDEIGARQEKRTPPPSSRKK